MTTPFGKIATALVLSLPLALAACDDDSDKTAGEKLDEAVQSASDAGQDLKDAAENAADSVEQKANEVSDSIQKSVQD